MKHIRDIEGYEGLYAITSCGKVWSYRTQKFLKPFDTGYLQVILSKNGVKKHYYIHKLVAETYLENPEGKAQVNHKDENHLHNWIVNLEWATPKENVNYGTRTERQRKAICKKVYCVELDRTFESIKAASEELNINMGGISRCVNGKGQTAGKYHWRYAI